MTVAMGGATPPLRVALVEDDRIEGERAIAALRSAGHEVEWFTEGVQFMAEVREARHELFLFDWHLPDTEGPALVGWVHRSVGRRAPIIIFSRFDDDERIVQALAAGADDYIIKPTAPSVLLARIAAVTRRFQGTATAPLLIEFGPYRIDGAARELSRDGERIDLQPKEFDLAWYLFLHRDRLVRREELIAAIWGRDLGGSARTLDTHLYTLRRKLMFAENGLRLSNVYREGYRLEMAPPATAV
jgi:DNA-binding response OmpR family regulator